MLYYDSQVHRLVAEERVADLRRSIGSSRRTPDSAGGLRTPRRG